MFNQLTALGWGLVSFALIIGVGTVMLYQFGGSIASCGVTSGVNASNYSSSQYGVWNSSTGECSNGTDSTAGAPVNTGYVNTNYLLGQIGQSGLAGWTPAIIAVSVGMLFLGAFLVGKGKTRDY